MFRYPTELRPPCCGGEVIGSCPRSLIGLDEHHPRCFGVEALWENPPGVVRGALEVRVAEVCAFERRAFKAGMLKVRALEVREFRVATCNYA